MNDIFRPLLDVYTIVYLDDILVNSKTYQDHQDHLQQVLDILRKNKLYAKPSKCKFFQKKVEFLGHIISGEGLWMDPDKIKMILE